MREFTQGPEESTREFIIRVKSELHLLSENVGVAFLGQYGTKVIIYHNSNVNDAIEKYSLGRRLDSISNNATDFS